MRNHLRAAVVLCLCAVAGAQTVDIGKNHRVVRASRHGVAAVEFDLEREAIGSEAAELFLQLPDRFAKVRLHRRQFESREGGNGLWRGSADEQTDSEVMLTLHEGYVAGRIRVGADLYEVRPSPDGHVVEKIDSTTFPACGGAADAPADAAAADAAAADGASLDGAGSPSFAAASVSPDAAGVYTIDLLSVYTPQARAAAGGPAQISAIIQAAVDAGNQSFANSHINVVYRLVRTAEAAHNDAGNLNTDLSWVVSNPATAALRNETGADLVSLIVENGAGYCGTGFVMRVPGPGFASAAFQVTTRGCAVGNLTFAHENGHNMGMEHDPLNGPPVTSASYPWSFGYLVNGVFRTVMSYATSCSSGCTRVPYFSNPDVSYLGYPTGVANVYDNARTANLTAAIVAGFRSPPSSSPPIAPASLAATAVSASQINLAWSDRSSDETGFRVERSQDGVNFSPMVTLGANWTTYSSTGLGASTRYFYRVRAYNGSGESANSNTADATTPAAPAPGAPSGLAATAVSSTQINLAWTDGSTNESGFRIERSSGGSAFSEIASTAAGVTSYASTGLTAGAAYSYRVRAFNGNGNSGYSNTATATTQGVAPAAPTGLAATAASSSQINLAWTDGSSNESGFRIERSSGGGGFSEIATVGAGATSYASTGLAAGTAYSYRVRAYNGNGNSGYSNTATASTSQAASALAPPTGFRGGGSYYLSGSTRVLFAVQLAWNDTVGESSYRIEKCKAASLTATCSYSAFRTTSANANSTTDYNVFNSPGIYKYRIRAENASVASSWVETTINAQ